jgi:hypothetical protein
MVSKLMGLFPTVRAFRYRGDEGVYYTLLMSTGLTFGTISSLFGLNHGIIDQRQYSFLVAAVIGSSVVPTMIANAYFLPRHLLPSTSLDEVEAESTTRAARASVDDRGGRRQFPSGRIRGICSTNAVDSAGIRLAEISPAPTAVS